MVIWSVDPAFHTPLMSVTNALSGIIVLGCMLEISTTTFFTPASICAFIGVFFASINVIGGFAVTHRMLSMFKTQAPGEGGVSPKKKHHWEIENWETNEWKERSLFMKNIEF